MSVPVRGAIRNNFLILSIFILTVIGERSMHLLEIGFIRAKAPAER